MAKTWKVMRFADVPGPRNFGVFRAADVVGLKSPVDREEAPCMIANCNRDEARNYALDLNSGKSLEDVRARRQYFKNMMYSGMN